MRLSIATLALWALHLPLSVVVAWSLFQPRFTPIANAENRQVGWLLVAATSLAPALLAAARSAGRRAPRCAAAAGWMALGAVALDGVAALVGVLWLARGR